VRYEINSEADHYRLVSRLASAPFKRPYTVTADFGDGRTVPQNNHLHPVIRQVAKHMMANGAPQWSEKRWRDYFVGKFLGQECLPDPDGSGGYVVLNRASGTSSLSKKEASDMLEWLYALGTDIGVKF